MCAGCGGRGRCSREAGACVEGEARSRRAGAGNTWPEARAACRRHEGAGGLDLLVRGGGAASRARGRRTLLMRWCGPWASCCGSRRRRWAWRCCGGALRNECMCEALVWPDVPGGQDVGDNDVERSCFVGARPSVADHPRPLPVQHSLTVRSIGPPDVGGVLVGRLNRVRPLTWVSPFSGVCSGAGWIASHTPDKDDLLSAKFTGADA